MRWKFPGWCVAAVVCGAAMCTAAGAQSVYPLQPDDAHAVVLTRAAFGAVGDGVADDADALQRAIDQAQATVHHGIVFVPEGRYRLGHTVHVWAGIRLIGVGAQRPVLVLGAKTPGFGAGPDAGPDAGATTPMLWFTDERTPAGEPIADASEFTFFSAVSNIDFEIGAGNPAAVAVRFNVAQHSFVAHANFELGDARAALEQVGNQAYDIHVHGGQYGIETGKTSPAWQFLLMDSSFDGQTVAAISTHEAGMTLVRDQFSHMTLAIEIPKGQVEQLYGRDLVMRDIRGAVLKMGDTNNVRNEITLENVVCLGVTMLGVPENGSLPSYSSGMILHPPINFIQERFTMGLEIGPDGRPIGIREEQRYRPLLNAAEKEKAEQAALKTDLPALPPMSTWVNVRTLGVKGDGETDDTKAIQKATDNHRVLYFPSGFYRLRGPVWLWGDSVLIGFSPFTTQFVLADHDATYQGPGAAIPMLVAPDGGGNIVTGIGIATGNGNPRAMGVEWQAGPHSLLEDVDFWSGRSEYVQALEPAAPKPLPRGERAPMEANAQYPSLWVKGGGGVLRGIWSHATTARAGLVIEDTTRPGAIYQFSCEHHMQNEVRLEKAQHWRIYDLQTEEENPAGQNAVPVELDGVHDVTFANTYMYRVSRTVLPKLYAVVARDADGVAFDNVKVFSQTRLAFDNSVHEEDSSVDVRAHHFVHFAVEKDAQTGAPLPLPAAFAPGAKLERVATGFSNADGLAAGPDGAVYFTDAVKNTVYRLDPAEKNAEAIAEVPQSPMAVGVVAPGVLVTLNRDTSASEITKTDSGTWTVTTLENQAGPLAEGTKLLLPVGLHAELEKLTLLLDHKGYKFRVGSNTAKRSGLEDVPASYFYAGTGEPGQASAAMPAMPVPMFRPLHESSQLAQFAVGETHLVVSEDDAKTWRATLDKNEELKTELFAERGGTSVVEDAAGNVYIASGQVTVYDRDGKEEGVLEVPERPGSLCFGGEDGKTLFIGARGSVYGIATRAAGRGRTGGGRRPRG
ncbi:MAG: glycosyl hydrolase family 28-related protein [Acidobacteriaceae bacterium]